MTAKKKRAGVRASPEKALGAFEGTGRHIRKSFGNVKVKVREMFLIYFRNVIIKITVTLPKNSKVKINSKVIVINTKMICLY